MKRVLILGCCGAGKTQFACKLASIIELPIIHLDQLYWQKGWQEPNRDIWIEKVMEATAQNRWIIDGNYYSTLDMRLQAADTAIYLDYSTWTCLHRVFVRTLTYWRRVRPDIADGCPERWSLSFLYYVLTYRRRKRKKMLATLHHERKAKRTKIHIFKNDEDAVFFLRSLSKKSMTALDN